MLTKTSWKFTPKTTFGTVTSSFCLLVLNTMPKRKCACCNDKRFLCERTYYNKYLHFPDNMPLITTRCPLCVDLQGAVNDRELGIQYYFDEKHPVIRRRYRVIRTAIKKKFPDWSEENLSEPMYDRIEIPDTSGDIVCRYCQNERVIPGCGGSGSRPSQRLKMSCGYDLRCPGCVDYKGAIEDKQVFCKCIEDDDDDSIYDQVEKIVIAVKAKYPDWVENEHMQLLGAFG